MSPPESMPEANVAQTDRKLKRALGAWDISFLVVGAMIGSGWLFGALGGAYTAGPAAVVSWLLAGLLMLFVAVVYAELGGMLPKSGGIVRYPQYAFGGLASFLFSWAYLLSAISVAPSEAIAVVTYMASYVPQLLTRSGVLSVQGLTVGLLLMVIFFVINWYGVKVLGDVNTGAGIWKLAIPSLTFLLLLFFAFHPSNFVSLKGGFVPYGLSAVLVAIPTQGIAYSYLGFRQGIDFSGEAKGPRDVVIGTIAGFLITVAVYVMLQVSFIGGINWRSLGVSPGNWEAIYAILHSGPFYEIMVSSGNYVLSGFALVILIDAVVSPAGTGWIYIGTTARTIYGMAASGHLPSSFIGLNSHSVPLTGTAVAFLAGLLFFLPFPTWYAISSFIVLTTVLTYSAGGPALVTLRKTAAHASRPLKLPAGTLLGALAMMSAFLIVYWSTYYVFWFVFILIMGGMPMFFAYSAKKNYGSNQKLGYIVSASYLAVLALSSYFLIYRPIISLTGWPTATSISLVPATSSVLADFVSYVALVASSLFLSLLAVYLSSNPKGKLHIRSGLWVFGLLMSAYVLSFLGSYGVLESPVLPFPLDTIAALLISIPLFWWGVKSGIPTDELAEALKEM
ncbi:MAG: APC family permease [TACK group archaeon]|nr:APC family permease [TACK group archaeon]